MERPGTAENDPRAKEVGSSAAITFLQSLVEEGKISSDLFETLRSQYERLHGSVLAMYASESALLQKAKELNGAYSVQKVMLDAKASESAQSETHLMQLRQMHLETGEEFRDQDDSRNMVRFELEELDRARLEKEMLLMERKRRAQTELQPQILALQDRAAEVAAELEQLRDHKEKEAQSGQTLSEDTAVARGRISQLENAVGRSRRQLEQMRGEPERHQLQLKMMANAAQRFVDELGNLQQDMERKERELEAIAETRKSHEQQRLDTGYRLEMLRAAIDKRQRSLQDGRNLVEAEQERRAALTEKRARAAWQLAEEKRSQHAEQEMSNALRKECDQIKKRFDKIRRKNATLEQFLPPLRDQYAQCTLHIGELESEQRRQKVKLDEFKKEEELFISQYLAQEKNEEQDAHMLAGVEAEGRQLEKKLAELEAEEKDLRKQISEIEASREMMARAASSATAQARDAKDALKVKQLFLMDLEKQGAETVARLEKCSNLYEIIKNQRNRYANLTQGSAQALSEMREKVKILANEADILRNDSASRDQVLNEETRLHSQSKAARDATRLEHNKLQVLFRSRKEREGQLLLEIEKLNAALANAEKEMLRLRKAYGSAVESRNQVGMQLIDRGDELGLLHEKKKLHGTILLQGERQLDTRGHELHCLHLQLAELQRRLEAARKQLPPPSAFETAHASLRNLERELEAEQAQTGALAKQLESPAPPQPPSQPQPVDPAGELSNKLKGADPSSSQLSAKLDALEERLNEKKEQLLERELILEEVSTLSDKLKHRTAEGRAASLELATQLNGLQDQLRKATRKMMALVSELSMYQASAMKLQHEKLNLEELVTVAGERLRDGLPPTDDAEYEWIRLERDRAYQQEALMNRARELADPYSPASSAPAGPGIGLEAAAAFNPSLIRTTAPVRPNAYLPDEIGIPKPYGNLAPFKPSTPGAAMRHFRKPVVKDIVI